jgi:hypothetical protein
MTQPLTAKPIYRKIGGIHWLALGRWRMSVCRTRTDAPSPRLGWLMLPACALMASCATIEPVASYALVLTGQSGNEYVLEHGLSASDCDAEIGAYDRTSGDVRCVLDTGERAGTY